MKSIQDMRDELADEHIDGATETLGRQRALELHVSYLVGFDSATELVFERIVESLNSSDAMIEHMRLDIESGRIGSRPYQFADWLTKNKERILK